MERTRKKRSGNMQRNKAKAWDTFEPNKKIRIWLDHCRIKSYKLTSNVDMFNGMLFQMYFVIFWIRTISLA